MATVRFHSKHPASRRVSHTRGAGSTCAPCWTIIFAKTRGAWLRARRAGKDPAAYGGFHRRRNGSRSRQSQRSRATELRHRRHSVTIGRLRTVRNERPLLHIDKEGTIHAGSREVEMDHQEGRICWRQCDVDDAGPAQRRSSRHVEPRPFRHQDAAFAKRRKKWTESPAPQYPPMPEGYVPKLVPFFNKPLEWAFKLVWSLAPGGADEPGVMWCGTMPGGLFKSEDNGDSWELVRSLWDDPMREEWGPNGAEWPGIHSICVDPRDSRHVSIGVSTGGVWITRDGGKTWKVTGGGMRADYVPEGQMQIPNSGRALPGAVRRKSGEFWVQHHNGIFKSTDGAATWTEIKDVKPSFLVLPWPYIRRIQIPRGSCLQPRTRSAVRPTAASSSIERATAERHSKRCEGLPQKYAYDLVYRHALDIDETATASYSDRQPDRYGSAKTAAIPGKKFPRICLRSMP